MWAEESEPDDGLHVYDLSAPKQPSMSSTVKIRASMSSSSSTAAGSSDLARPVSRKKTISSVQKPGVGKRAPSRSIPRGHEPDLLVTFTPRGALRGFTGLETAGWKFPQVLSNRVAVLTHHHDVLGVGHWHEHDRSGVSHDLHSDLAAVGQPDAVDRDLEDPPREDHFPWKARRAKLMGISCKKSSRERGAHPQAIEHVLEVVRERRVEHQSVSVSRVRERQARGMQERTFEP